MFGFLILSIPLFVQTLHNLLMNKVKKKNKKKEAGGLDMNVWCEVDSGEASKKEAGDNLWGEVDENLLGEIMGRLCLTDQVRFRVVCKNWLAARPITNSKPLPWYFVIDRSLPTVSKRLEFRIYEPLSPPTLASVHNILLPKLGIRSPPSYKDVSVSNIHNWFFIVFRMPRLFLWTRRYYLLFSVFTKKIITLPKLDYPCLFMFMRTVSTDPDSPNCVFFLLDTDHAGKIVVITYRNGDKEWTAKEFDRVVEFLPCICHPVYIRGIMYIVSPYGQLASYNIVNGEFKFLNFFVDELFRLNYISSRFYRVFELNGELMLIYFGSRMKNNTTSLGKQCIKVYDWSNKVWIPVSTLGDNALFVNDNFFEVTIVNREATSINGVLSNKLYRFFDCGCLIYSIEDGDLVEFKFINPNLLEDGSGNLPEYKYNRDISFSYATKAVCWLDPPRVSY